MAHLGFSIWINDHLWIRFASDSESKGNQLILKADAVHSQSISLKNCDKGTNVYHSLHRRLLLFLFLSFSTSCSRCNYPPRKGTPNGHKISIALEELKTKYGVDYKVHPISFAKNEQKEEWFLKWVWPVSVLRRKICWLISFHQNQPERKNPSYRGS
jgi:hypothetical protein